MRALVAVVLLPLLAALPARAVDRDYAGVRSVGIVSVLGGVLHLKGYAIIPVAGEGDRRDISIAAWGLDDWAERAIAARLATRFSVKPVEVDRFALATCVQEGNCGVALRPSTEVDAYVVLEPSVAPDLLDINAAAQSIGVGFFHQRSPWGSVNHVYVFARIAVLDAHTGREIDFQTLRMPGADLFGGNGPLLRKVDSDLWPSGPPSQRQLSDIRGIVFDLLRTGLTHTLPAMGLVPGG